MRNSLWQFILKIKMDTPSNQTTEMDVESMNKLRKNPNDVCMYINRKRWRDKVNENNRNIHIVLYVLLSYNIPGNCFKYLKSPLFPCNINHSCIHAIFKRKLSKFIAHVQCAIVNGFLATLSANRAYLPHGHSRKTNKRTQKRIEKERKKTRSKCI